MANELKHKAVGTVLTQVEFEATDSHVFNSQATGDIVIAGTTSQLERLGIGSTNNILTVSAGKPAWTATPTLTTVDATTDFTVGTTVVADDVITFTPTTSDTVTLTAAADGAFSLVTVDDGGAAANIQITADGTVDIDSAGVLTLDSGAAINIEPASGSAILLDGTISIDAGAVTGATSITSTAFVGTLSTAAQANVTSLGTLTALQVDFINANASTLTITDSSDTGDYSSIVTTTHGATTITTVDDDAAAANFTVTADGTIDLDSTGALTLDSGAAINLEPAAGSVILLDGILTVDAGVVVPVATAHNAAGTAISISAGATTAGTTNNIAGGALTIQGGQGKGSGAGGDIIFKTANAGGSGSSLNALATALTISDDLSSTFAGTVSVADNINVSFGTGNDATIDYDGTNLVIDSKVVGSGFISIPGGGIGFPATQVAYGGANVLDDYEEGTWTPAFADGNLDGSGESQAYDLQTGRYTKIGDRVYLGGYIIASSLGTLTSGANSSIVGLPFASANVANLRGGISVHYANGLAISAGTTVTGMIGVNVTNIFLNLWDVSTGTSGLLVSELTDDARLEFSGFYEV